MPVSEKPKVFTGDFLPTVIGASGGAARPIIPILKATGLLNQGGVPTELYSQFQTESGRSAAALAALRHGYAEIFKRNQYAHRADEKTLTDVIVSITGLPRSEKIVRYILNTFQTFQAFARSATDEVPKMVGSEPRVAEQATEKPDGRDTAAPMGIGLVYNINVALPETTDIDVYNAIFRSLRANLLQ
jgi:hypothetical protein